jgi:alcohol dehydrogenase
VIRTVAEWLPTAVADGRNLEGRSRMLLAAHYAGIGQQSGTGVGAVHAIGHAIGTRGRLAHGTALATVMPEVLETYFGTRDRELALVAVALGVAGPRDPAPDAARGAVTAIDAFLRSVGQRRTLTEQGLGPETPETIARDSVDDAAMSNSPRIPSRAEVLAILGRVAGAA